MDVSQMSKSTKVSHYTVGYELVVEDKPTELLRTYWVRRIHTCVHVHGPIVKIMLFFQILSIRDALKKTERHYII